MAAFFYKLEGCLMQTTTHEWAHFVEQRANGKAATPFPGKQVQHSIDEILDWTEQDYESELKAIQDETPSSMTKREFQNWLRTAKGVRLAKAISKGKEADHQEWTIVWTNGDPGNDRHRTYTTTKSGKVHGKTACECDVRAQAWKDMAVEHNITISGE